MSFLQCELRKTLSLPVLWVFLTLCLALNLLLIFENNYGREYFNDTSADASLLGQRVDSAFIVSLSELPRTENRDYLLASVESFSDVFSDYDAAGLGAYYESSFDRSPLAASWIHQKYTLVAERIAELTASGAGMELYAADMTYASHQFLFDTLLRAVTAEAVITGVLAALYLTGCENVSHTVSLLCSSRAGRRQWLWKALTGVVCALILWLLLAVCSLAVYFSLWGYGGVWASNVSSGYNYVVDGLFVKPFITWSDFTVAGYLAASLGMSAALTAVCALLASLAGILIWNMYAAALVMLLFGTGGLSAAVWLANRMLGPAYIVSRFQPVILWLDEGIWFTDSGLNTVLPWQEPIIIVLWLTLGLAGTLLAYRRFAGKDIA